MTPKERRVVEDLHRQLYGSSGYGYRLPDYNQVWDLYDKLERVGLMPLPKENTQ